jgi:hypothetical protein
MGALSSGDASPGAGESHAVRILTAEAQNAHIETLLSKKPCH